MQERWRFLGHGELHLQLLAPGRIHVQLILHHRRRDALHHHLDQLLAPGVQPFYLARRSRQARTMLHPEPVHLARELFAELIEQVLAQELLLEGLQDARLDLVAPDGQAVVAGPLLARAETGEAVPAGHDEAGATHAALRQSREQVLRPSRDADVAGACDREAGRILTVLRGVPEIVTHDPEGRDLPRDPFRLWIQARDAPTRVRILHVSQPVPNHPADVQLVVQDAGAPFLVPVDRAWTPGSSKRSGDSLLIQSPGNRLRRDAGNVFPEDTFDDGGLRRLDLPLACRDGAAVHRLHHAVAVTETACGLPILDAPAQSSMRLVGQVLQEQRVHRPLEPDVQVRDIAFRKGDDVGAGEGEALEETGRVLLVAAEAVQRFGQHNVEATVQRVPHQRLESRPQKRGT